MNKDSLLRVISTTLNQWWGGRDDNKDVDAVENFGKTDQAIDYITATLQIIGVRCCRVWPIELSTLDSL